MQSLKNFIGQVNDDPEIRKEIQEAFDTMVARYETLSAIIGDMSRDDATNNTTWLDFKQRRDVQEKIKVCIRRIQSYCASTIVLD